MTVRKLGGATIEKVEEICGPGFKPHRMFPKFNQEAFDAQKGWMLPEHVEAGSDRLVGSVHTWIVKTPRHTILIDTCLGNDKQRTNPGWRNLDTPFLNRLKACGCDPNSVDLVMCTHLHVDHVGWNTMLVDGHWVPTFPKARYLMGRVEYRHWTTQREREDMAVVLADSVAPVWAAGLVDLVETDHRICDEISLVPTPGHTPGHVSLRIASMGEEALITGDFMHHPCQIARPDWSSTADSDPAEARLTRERMLTGLADTSILVICTPFAGRTAGHIVPDGGALRLVV